MSPGEIERAVGHAELLIFFRSERIAASRVSAMPMTKSSTANFVRLQGDGAPKRNDGIENRAGGVRKRRRLLHGRRTHQIVPPRPTNLAAVGFAGNFTLRRRPAPTSKCSNHGGFSSRYARAGCKESPTTRAMNSVCTNKIAEGGMRLVRRLGGQHHFGVTG